MSISILRSTQTAMAEGRLSQEGKTGNAVFKIFDENGLLVGAEKVGTSNVRFKSFDKGAADGYGFEIVSGKPANTYFFESAIDAISFADLYPEQRNYRLVSIIQVLKINKYIIVMKKALLLFLIHRKLSFPVKNMKRQRNAANPLDV